MTETKSVETTKPDSPLKRVTKILEDWMVWVVISGIAWITALALAVALVETLLAGLADGVGLFLARLGGGVLLGGLQWAYLLRGRARLPYFLLATALAWPLALLAYDLVLAGSQSPLLAAVGGLVGGSLMGVIQAVALLETAEKRQWLFSTIAGWAAALALGRQAVYDEVAPAASTWQYSVPLGIGWVLLALLAVVSIVLVLPRQKMTREDMKLPMWPKR
ncbi:MAG: hypothetical protein EPO32_12260 [Anaerolineae bacterium]|nr:MAG: hypothetical protein EPO32_12260 [Anaerolineae bacterium]